VAQSVPRSAVEHDDDTITIPLKLFEDLSALVAAQHQTLEQYPASVTGIIDQAAARLHAAYGEMTDEAIRSIAAAIPAILAKHAPDVSPLIFSFVTRDVFEYASERVATLGAARDLLRKPDEPTQG